MYYETRLVKSVDEVKDFVNKVGKETEVDINWDDSYSPDSYPAMMVMVIHSKKFHQFADVCYVYIFPEDFEK